ncbi:hypothetical protein [Paenibacillus sp. y28]|uniref:hypothetical protein n=1 Tax=Paenibacillus sp. y28 TaxID=3129110 RepID=UPI00301A12B5
MADDRHAAPRRALRAVAERAAARMGSSPACPHRCILQTFGQAAAKGCSSSAGRS